MKKIYNKDIVITILIYIRKFDNTEYFWTSFWDSTTPFTYQKWDDVGYVILKSFIKNFFVSHDLQIENHCTYL